MKLTHSTADLAFIFGLWAYYNRGKDALGDYSEFQEWLSVDNIRIEYPSVVFEFIQDTWSHVESWSNDITPVVQRGGEQQ